MSETIKKDENTGIFYYDELPDTVRPATLEDFFQNNSFIIGKWFIVHGFYSNKYECYKTKLGECYVMVLQFLNYNRIYVKKETI